MMTFDQILGAYEAFIRTREVQDDVEWSERKEPENNDGRGKTETE